MNIEDYLNVKLEDKNVTVDRKKYFGGSDIPIILGISPFKSRFDLLLEKAGLTVNDFKGNEYTEYGNLMEPLIRNHINESLYKKDPFKEDSLIVEDLRGNVDGVNKQMILEIKTTSQIKNNLEDYKLYLVQLLFYMKLYDKKKGILAVYERPKDFNPEFDVKRLQTFMVDISNFKDLLNEIDLAIEQFRVDLKEVKENPQTTEEDLQPNGLVELSNKIEKIEYQLKAFKELEKKQKEFKEQLKIAMEENNVKKWTTDNGTQITLVADKEDEEVEVKKVDTELFEKENAKLIKEYNETKEKYIITEKTIKKGRKGYVRITL